VPFFLITMRREIRRGVRFPLNSACRTSARGRPLRQKKSLLKFNFPCPSQGKWRPEEGRRVLIGTGSLRGIGFQGKTVPTSQTIAISPTDEDDGNSVVNSRAVPQRLTVHAAGLCRGIPAHALQHQSQCQHPPRCLCVPAPRRSRRPYLLGRHVRPRDRDRSRHPRLRLPQAQCVRDRTLWESSRGSATAAADVRTRVPDGGAKPNCLGDRISGFRNGDRSEPGRAGGRAVTRTRSAGPWRQSGCRGRRGRP